MIKWNNICKCPPSIFLCSPFYNGSLLKKGSASSVKVETWSYEISKNWNWDIDRICLCEIENRDIQGWRDNN